MIKLTIGITGKISSGKSSIAKAIEKTSGIPQASFGGYLLTYSKENNLPIDRLSLQNLGAQFIEQSPEAFLAAVLEHANLEGNQVIIEGIRHLSILKALKVISQTVFTIYIDATSETRYKRYSQRRKESDAIESYDDFLLKSQHPVEQQIELIKPECNLIIDSEILSIDQAVEQIRLSLQTFSSA